MQANKQGVMIGHTDDRRGVNSQSCTFPSDKDTPNRTEGHLEEIVPLSEDQDKCPNHTLEDLN